MTHDDPIKPAVDALTAAHTNPAFASEADLRACCAPIVDVAARLDQQLSEYERLIDAIEDEAADRALDGKFRHIQNEIVNIRARIAVIKRETRDVPRGLRKLAGYIKDLPAHVDHVRNADPASGIAALSPSIRTAGEGGGGVDTPPT